MNTLLLPVGDPGPREGTEPHHDLPGRDLVADAFRNLPAPAPFGQPKQTGPDQGIPKDGHGMESGSGMQFLRPLHVLQMLVRQKNRVGPIALGRGDGQSVLGMVAGIESDISSRRVKEHLASGLGPRDVGFARGRQQKLVADVPAFMELEHAWRLHDQPVREP